MEERITWSEIDASPLLQLSCQERARLRETGDERFRAFWSDCFDAYQLSKTNGAGIDNKTNQTLDELEIDIGAFSDAFLNAFVTYQPNPEKPGQTFSIYLSSAVKHAQAKSHAADTSAVSRFNWETTRKVKAGSTTTPSCSKLWQPPPIPIWELRLCASLYRRARLFSA